MWGSLTENETPTSQTHELKLWLSSVGEHLSKSISDGLLGSPALDFEMSARSQEIDSVTEKMQYELVRLNKEVDCHVDRDTDPSPSDKWSTLSSAISWLLPSKGKRLEIEISQLVTLLEETLKRRTPYIEVYQIVYQNRLAESSYSFFCHEEDFPSLGRKFKELRKRHRLLHEMGVMLVQANESVHNLSKSNPSVLCHEISDGLLESLKLALRITAEYADAGQNFTRSISHGLAAVRRFDTLLLYYMAYEFASGAGMKGSPFRIEEEYKEIMSENNLWRRKLLSNEGSLRRLTQFHGPLRMSAYLDERPATMERELAAQLMVKKEMSAWNLAGATLTTLSINTQEYTSYHLLAKKFEEILHTRIVSSRRDNIKSAAVVYGEGTSLIHRVSLVNPLEILWGDIAWKSSEVAVKILINLSEADACSALLPEARVWSRLNHENVLPFYGTWMNFNEPWSHSGGLGLVAPWMDQGTLQSFLQENPRTSDSQRLRLVVDVAKALHFLHSQTFRIAHGDIKANNVMLKDGRAFLCDFGMSKVLDGVTGLPLTASRNWRWEAPELLRHTNNAGPTPESDMYSFGMLCLEAMTGRVPWEDLSHVVGLQRRMESRFLIPKRPRTKVKDTALWDFMLCCWKDAPTLRPTVQEAMKALRSIIQKIGELN